MSTRNWSKATAIALLSLTVALTGCTASKPAETPKAQEPAKAEAPKNPIKIAVVTSRSGAFEAWGTHELRGLEIGLDYATGGKMEVNGHKIELKVYDDQGKADTGKAMAEQAITEWKADIIQGTVSSGIATAILPIINQYQKIFMAEPAAADTLTGVDFTKYLFRTGANTSQDALAGAVGATKLGKKIMQLGQDNTFGKSSTAAWEAIEKANGATVETLLIPQDTTDFTPYFQQILAKQPEVLVVHWAGANGTQLFQQAGEQGVYQKVKVTGGIADFAAMKTMGPKAAGMTGMVKYFHTLPKNAVNDYLVTKHKEKFNGELPDLFTGGGMAAGIAIVEGLKKTGGEANADKLIAAMEGMKFQGPKGEYEFRKEDHQALQTMYIVELAMNPGFDFPTPKLIQELKPSETAPPVTAKK
ncbi:MAG TPA: substrate-binding domain-containing protein [Symbiobacteriaceae bacterium]|nr:substrate-binding domain-containing protein [Symbiobacteriaceae bacterium]